MVAPLTRQERVFLAGCIKSMLLADGTIEPQEIAELDVLIKTLKFNDFEECLTEFEDTVTDEEGFWDLAKVIQRAEARKIVFDSLDALMLHEGIPEKTQEHLVAQLETIWKK